MVTQDVHALVGIASLERVAAQGDDAALLKGAVHPRFVLSEAVPLGVVEPEGVPRQAKAFVPSRAGGLLPLHPATNDVVSAEGAAAEIPVVVVDDLELIGRDAVEELGRGGQELLARLLGGERR